MSTLEERIERIKELIARRDEAVAELRTLLGMDAEGADAPPRATRKAAAIPRKGGRPCGCGPKGRHRSGCTGSVETGTAPGAWDPDRKVYPCCGSKHHARHKTSCKVNASDGKLPPDTKTWKCVNCEKKVKADEAPEACKKCDGAVLVEVEDWQE